MGENWLAVIPHPPILIWTISEEGALETWRTLSYGLFYSYLWPESSMVPDGHRVQSTNCPDCVVWSLGFSGLCLLFLYSQWIRAGLRLPIFFLLCTSTLVSRKKKKSPFFFFKLFIC